MHDLIIEIVKPLHLLFYIFAYGLSATPTSYLVARIIHKTDLKKAPGHRHTASYVWKTMSKRSGALVFGLDLLKGLIPCAIAQSLEVPLEIIALIGFFAVLGHCFSMWLSFSGGHGGTTAAGAMLIVFWPAAIANMGATSLLMMMRFSAAGASMLGSLIGMCVLFFGLTNKAVWLIVAAMTAVIIVRHLSLFLKRE